MKKSGRFRVMLTAALAALTAFLSVQAAWADTGRLPNVSAEMNSADYWKSDGADTVLADRKTIETINAAALACEDCKMNDLLAEVPPFDGMEFKHDLLKRAMQELSGFLDANYYDAGGKRITYTKIDALLRTIDEPEGSSRQEARYGICVRMTDVRAVPTESIITDDAGDNDFDLLQLSSLRINEPVLILSQNDDGSWLYCDSSSISGWVPAEDIAVCADREQWLSAWNIPDDELLVVTQGKIYLDRSNVNEASSQCMLTMGTVLRRVKEEDYDAAVTNRASIHNYAVYLPVRKKDGSYGTTIGLIPQHSDVSEGWLPLTEENLLNTAFSMLGDAYGWGGMLSVPDCSQYVRNVYKCFGLELPRNTTWQMELPAKKVPLAGLSADRKAALLEKLPAGAILFFKGHEMLYLGEEGGRHYVLSSVSSMMDPKSKKKLRVRSVVINTLEDILRMNGHTWLEDLSLAVIPYEEPAAEEELPYQNEQEYNALLKRSELTLLSKAEGTIYVTGHKSPDSDTVGSAIAYAELLRKLGIDAKAVVIGKINKESEFILKEAGVEAPELLEDASGLNMVLVDHSDYEQSANGLKDANVLGIIDHHGDGSVRTNSSLLYDARPFGATATIIWLHYRDYGLEPDPKTALVMVGSILSDTHNLTDVKTTYADQEALKALCELSGLEDLESFYNTMVEESLSYEGMTDEEIFFNDRKEFECEGVHYGIAVIKTTDPEKAADLAERMKAVLPKARAASGMDMEFAQVSVNSESVSMTYLVPSDDHWKEVLGAAIGDRAEWNGTAFVLTPSITRKAVVVPAVTEALSTPEE